MLLLLLLSMSMSCRWYTKHCCVVLVGVHDKSLCCMFSVADIVEMNLDMTPEEIDIFVSATMSQVSNGGETISYDQYNAYAQNNREKFQAEMTVKIKERCMGGTVH
jgi:hypothetical protein